jgi:putative transposase
LGDAWHLDEVFIKIRGELHYLWRAVDQDGDTLDIPVQKRRNKSPPKRFFHKLLKGQNEPPWLMIADKLKSYSAALREVLPSITYHPHSGGYEVAPQGGAISGEGPMGAI